MADGYLEGSDIELPDMIILPGGIKGADNFAASENLVALLKR